MMGTILNAPLLRDLISFPVFRYLRYPDPDSNTAFISLTSDPTFAM